MRTSVNDFFLIYSDKFFILRCILNENVQLTLLREQHFEILKKNNAITDAKNGMLSLGAMKTMDIILKEYQTKEQEKITLELAFLRKRLGLETNNDYVERIKLYLTELKLPFELRDYTERKTGKRVDWHLTSFIGEVVSYKEFHHLVDITISSGFIDYMVEKAGYTQINMRIARQFKTKFGYKLYEMYRRYYNLPNMHDSKMGHISKTLEELNEKFGTNYVHASKLFPGINRGIKEIAETAGEELYFLYDKVNKQFVFSWPREGSGDLKKKCIIPAERIDELCEWIILHHAKKIKDEVKFYNKVRTSIIKNSWKDLENSYRGMLKYRYAFSDVEIDSMKSSNGKYKDFTKLAQGSLF